MNSINSVVVSIANQNLAQTVSPSQPEENSDSTTLESGIPIIDQRLTRKQITERALEKLSRGFTKVPNSLLIEMIHGDLSKAELKVLLLTARFTLGFENREFASLSKADIERYTNLKGSTVLAAGHSLGEKNLIEKIQGDQYTANKLKITAKHLFLTDPPLPPPHPSPKGKTITQQKEKPEPPMVDSSPQGTNSAYPEGRKSTYPQGLKSASPEGQKSTHFKESFSKNSFKESLSKSDCPLNDPSAQISTLPTLESHFEKVYFSQIRAPKVLQEEREAFRAIIGRNGDITLEEFLECCKIVARQKDKQGNAIVKKFVWMSGGFDSILNSTRASLRDKQRKAEFAQGEPVSAPAPVEVTQSECEPESETVSETAENTLDRTTKSEVQAQIQALTAEISRHEYSFVCKLEEGDFCKLKSLRKARFELCEQHNGLIGRDPIAIWNSELEQNEKLKASITALHQEFPAIVAIAHRRLDALSLEIQEEIKAYTRDRENISALIAKSLGTVSNALEAIA